MVVTAIKRQVSKRSGAEFARLTVEDFSGSSEVLVFPEAWAALADRVRPEVPVLLRGRVFKARPGRRQPDFHRRGDHADWPSCAHNGRVVVAIDLDPTSDSGSALTPHVMVDVRAVAEASSRLRTAGGAVERWHRMRVRFRSSSAAVRRPRSRSTISGRSSAPSAYARACELIVSDLPLRLPLLPYDWLRRGEHVRAARSLAVRNRHMATSANTLEFERPLVELEKQIDELKKMARRSADARRPTRSPRSSRSSPSCASEIYRNLTPFQRVQVARSSRRPFTLDYIRLAFTDFIELHGDRAFRDDSAIIGGWARLDGETVMVIGHQRGRDAKENLHRNFGMPHPEGYRKALRLMKIAEKFHVPVITFIDTPGRVGRTRRRRARPVGSDRPQPAMR